MKFKHGTRRRALEYEKDWAKRWKDNKTFEKSVENRSADNAYVFYDGPPFITGVPHHGTLLSSIVKDAVPRYWTMKGKRVERVWGWDTHGLPAENFVEKQLNITDRRQIVANSDEKAPLDKDGNPLPTISLETYINKARESMVANAATWENVVDRVGRWVDFKGAYKTMDKNFMESVWWAFKELYDKGKIYEGEKVLMYDTKFATPVSKNEVTMDNDAYQTVTDPSVYVKFKLKDKKSYLLAWTTTPWTLPGNTALAVNKDFDYIEVELLSSVFQRENSLATKGGDDPIVSVAKDILGKFDNIKYGYIDNNNSVHLETDSDFDQREFIEYRLQDTAQIKKNNIGTCWDQSEYARYLLESEGISVKNYAIVYYDHEKLWRNHSRTSRCPRPWPTRNSFKGRHFACLP